MTGSQKHGTCYTRVLSICAKACVSGIPVQPEQICMNKAVTSPAQVIDMHWLVGLVAFCFSMFLLCFVF